MFLFALTLLSAGVSIYFLANIRNRSRNIIRSNTESMEYGHAMLRAIQRIEAGDDIFIDSLSHYLQLEEANITEPGERQAFLIIQKAYDRLTGTNTDAVLRRESLSMAADGVYRVLGLNLRASQDKMRAAEQLADDALAWLVLAVSVIFVVGLTFAYNFPSVITRPVRKLTEGIREISAKNYAARVRIDSGDEFGEMAQAFNDMAARLQYFESSSLSRILFEKSRAEAVINSLKEASIGIDQQGVVLFANDQALQLLHLDTESMVGVPVAELSKTNDLFRFLVEEQSLMPFKILVDNRENYFTKEQLTVAVEDASYQVIVLRNITSFKELDQAKTNFIATISHELKTPLASSDLSLRLLEDARVGKLAPDQLELVQALKLDNQRMLKILSELLNMAQVEAGKISLQLTDADPLSIIGAAVSFVQSQAREKRIRVDVLPDLLSPGGDLIRADQEKTGWVITNFLTNAIRYSPADATITVRALLQDHGVAITVHDNGPGIAEEHQSKIFDRFFRIPGSGEGTGLGLAISKDFIEAQRGRIWVQSEMGKGTTFGVWLPGA